MDYGAPLVGEGVCNFIAQSYEDGIDLSQPLVR
jgi:hypothetical protein